MKKSEKIQQEIESSESKIFALQARVVELKREKVNTENAELVSMVRDLDCCPGELKEILRAIKAGDLDFLMEHMAKAKEPS